MTGKFILVFIVGCWPGHDSTCAQDIAASYQLVEDRFYIEWIGQVSPDDVRKKKTLIDKIGGFIWGSEPALMNRPVAVLAMNPDQMWILDQNSQTIIEYRDGKEHQPQSLKRNHESFPSLVDLTVIPEGNILFTDSYLNQVFCVSPQGDACHPLNPFLTLDQPTGIAYSKVTNEIWVTETGAHCITVLTPDGHRVRSIGKRGTEPGEFNFPTYISIDERGDIYVVDAMNFRIQIFNSKGEYLNDFGEIGQATGYFASPKGIATDHYGNIYVVDALFHSVQVFDREGALLSYFGTQGQEKEHFWLPTGIYIDDMDRIYVADGYNSRVQIFKIKPMAK